MTMYALVQNDTIVQVGSPRTWFDGERWWDFRASVDPASGWLPVTEVDPPGNTATTTYDRSIQLVNGTPTVVWVPRSWTAEEQAARTAAANAAVIRQRATNALNVNSTFLGLATPTNAQNAAQLQALTRQMNGLIKLELNDLGSVSGT